MRDSDMLLIKGLLLVILANVTDWGADWIWLSGIMKLTGVGLCTMSVWWIYRHE